MQLGYFWISVWELSICLISACFTEKAKVVTFTTHLEFLYCVKIIPLNIIRGFESQLRVSGLLVAWPDHQLPWLLSYLQLLSGMPASSPCSIQRSWKVGPGASSSRRSRQNHVSVEPVPWRWHPLWLPCSPRVSLLFCVRPNVSCSGMNCTQLDGASIYWWLKYINTHYLDVEKPASGHRHVRTNLTLIQATSKHSIARALKQPSFVLLDNRVLKYAK